ncbi:hypothetical protein MRX96_057283, partial [Rhipicephalus microplus]
PVLQCNRCPKTFLLTEEGDYMHPEECVYHRGHLRYNIDVISGQPMYYYTCCSGIETMAGCCVSQGHVYDGPDPSFLTGFVSTVSKGPQPDGGCPGVYAIDCEMCCTAKGFEVIRVSVLGWDFVPVYDTLVKPQGKILDYKTEFNGLTEEHMVGVDTTLRDVQAALLERFSAETLLLGHSLDSDFRALRLIHTNVVDTCVVFPHYKGFPFKRALRRIVKQYLDKSIQDGGGGHNSQEDAAACIELMLWKVGEGLNVEV